MYDVCPNDCVLFRGKYSDASKCPLCGADRFKRGNLPARSFTYMPLGPRFERMYGTSNISLLMQSHSGSETMMYDIHDSLSWREAYSLNGVFQGDRRGISLGLCTDGVIPSATSGYHIPCGQLC